MVANCLTARWLRPILACFAFAGLAFLGGCGGGSGAPNNPFAPVPPAPTVPLILPATSVAYSNTPATLTISGGVAPYFVTSSNSAILPVAQVNTTGTIVLLPANVVADTAVTLQVTDSLGQTGSATVTVKAAPIFNTLTITPNSAACGTNAICSGQTATAKVTVTGPGGAGIPNRQVRFDVVAGAYSIESSDPANPLVSTLTVVSDQFGVAQVILQATPGAPTQPALLRATELTSGNQQTAQFTIVQTINGSAVLSVVPSSATITGPDSSTCSSGFRIDYYIYGGTPPYTVASTFPSAVTLSNSIVFFSGGAFSAFTNGTCVSPLTFTIRDSTGLQTTATLNNNLGTTAPPTPPPPSVTVTPGSITVGPGANSCTGKTFNFVISGGTPPFSVASAGGIVVPNPVTTSPGSFGISNFVDGSGAHTISIGDASTPQQTTTATVTCKP